MRSGREKIRKDLAVRGRRNGRKPHGYYHRLIALSLLHCMYDDWGNVLDDPLAIDESMMEDYEVHHWKNRWWACKTTDFIIVSTLLHQRITSGQVKERDMQRPVLLRTPQRD